MLSNYHIRFGDMTMVTRERKTIPLLLCCIFLIRMVAIVTPRAGADQFELAHSSDYITYIGGTNVEDATKVAFDNAGNTILIGQTQSSNLPVTDNAFQSEEGGGWDAFIAKFSPTGDLLFCSYLGGSGYEHVTAVIADADDNMIIAGTTQSTCTARSIS